MDTRLPPIPERLHALDAVRGGALLLGVLVHASMSWLPGAQWFWPVHDATPASLAGVAFYVPHMFRMLLFFLLAGFFARMARERLGAAGFLRDRARRIAAPLATAWFPMLMAIVAVTVWAAWIANHGQLPPAPPTPPLSPEELERYARHIVLPEVGGPGQQKLKRARVLEASWGGTSYLRDRFAAIGGY